MALPKLVKVGGSYVKGYLVPISSAPGDYTLVINNTNGIALNSLSVTPDVYGAGDTFSLHHMSDASGTGSVVAVLAQSVYNIGANVSVCLDFPAMQRISTDQSVKFIYNNTATKAMNVYLITEWVGITKTS